MTSATAKKPRTMNYLSVAERVAVIHEYDMVANIPYLARKFKCGRRQIRNILRRKEEYLENWNNNPNSQSMPRRHPARIKAINIALLNWCERAVLHDVELTDEVIKGVACRIAEAIKVMEFQPEKRWLERFKNKLDLAETHSTFLICKGAGKPSLDIDDVVKEVEPEINKFLIRKNSDSRNSKNSKRLNSVEISPSEHSNEAVEYVNVISDSDQSSHGSSENMLVKTQSSPWLSDLQRSSDGDMPDYFYPSVELEEESPAKSIDSYREALNHLGPLEQFVLFNENIRAIGLINQIENIFRDEMAKEKS